MDSFKKKGVKIFLTVYSVYIFDSAMFFKSIRHLFKTKGYQFYETRNRNKFGSVMDETMKLEKKTPYYYSCVDIFPVRRVTPPTTFKVS